MEARGKSESEGDEITGVCSLPRTASLLVFGKPGGGGGASLKSPDEPTPGSVASILKKWLFHRT